MLKIYFKTLYSFYFYLNFTLIGQRLFLPFVLFMAFLSWMMVYLAAGMFIQKTVPPLLQNMPKVTFENGKLTQPQAAVSVQIPNTPLRLMFDATPKAQLPAEDGKPLLWVHQDSLYLRANGQTSRQTLPEDLSFTTDTQTLQKYKSTLMSSLRIAVLIVSLPLILFLIVFYIAQAYMVGVIFGYWRKVRIPRVAIFRWALLMLGPTLTLFYIHLWVHIPLYSLAQVILCIIYMQQIYNSLERFPYED